METHNSQNKVEMAVDCVCGLKVTSTDIIDHINAIHVGVMPDIKKKLLVNLRHAHLYFNRMLVLEEQVIAERIARESEIPVLEEEVESLENKIRKKDEKLKSQEKKIEELEERIARECEIPVLQEEVESLAKQIREKDEKLKSQEKKIEELEKLINLKREKIDDFEGENKNRIELIEEDERKNEEIELLAEENGQIKEKIAQLESEKENRKEVVKIDGKGNIAKRGKARTQSVQIGKQTFTCFNNDKGINSFNCAPCGKTIEVRRLPDHKKRRHAKENVGNNVKFLCIECNKKYASKQSAVIHYVKDHKGKKENAKIRAITE